VGIWGRKYGPGPKPGRKSGPPTAGPPTARPPTADRQAADRRDTKRGRRPAPHTPAPNSDRERSVEPLTTAGIENVRTGWLGGEGNLITDRGRGAAQYARDRVATLTANVNVSV
jgi:hypothetical protein